MDGQLSSWKKYLEKEYLIWLNLCGCDSLIKSKIEEIIYSLPADITSVLIHGDAINPGNILIREGNIVGIVDWEWSIIGDPAWEFADTGWEKII